MSSLEPMNRHPAVIQRTVADPVGRLYRAIAKSAGSLFALVFAIVVSATFATNAYAANYPLELTNIKPIGGGLNSGHRIYRAYPGLEYNIRAGVIGGDYPYVYSLANAPSGMTINAATGEISWPNPQANATPTITVRDTAGVSVTASWAITVSTNGFKFVDAVNGQSAPTGTGTRAAPWRTMSDVWNNAAGTDIVYFRAGTYDQLNLPRTSVGSDWERVEWYRKASIWLAYPGERPIIDFGYRAGGSERAPHIRLNDDLVYVDGFETINSRLIGFQFTGNTLGGTFRRLRMHALGPGIDGSNASFIMTMINLGNPANFMVIQDSEFYDLTGNATTIKIYSLNKFLIEDTVHRNATVGLELKGEIPQFTVRNNRFYNVTSWALGGNMHVNSTSGEMLYNLIRNSSALQLNNDSDARQVFVYRNTFVGRVLVSATDSADGPFTFTNNVIVNTDSGTPAGSHITHEEVTAPERVIRVNNLVGSPSDGIVDSNGNLTPAYSQYIGARGYQQGPAPIRPNRPPGVAVQ